MGEYTLTVYYLLLWSDSRNLILDFDIGTLLPWFWFFGVLHAKIASFLCLAGGFIHLLFISFVKM